MPSKRKQFFLKDRLGRDTFDSMVKDVVQDVGIDVGDRNISNLSLRVSAMNVHDMMVSTCACDLLIYISDTLSRVSVSLLQLLWQVTAAPRLSTPTREATMTGSP